MDEAISETRVETTAEIVKNVLEHEPKFKTTVVSKQIDVEFDIGSLLVTDINPVNEKLLKKKKSGQGHYSNYLQDLNRDNIQLLLNKIWELPTERVEDAIVVALPDPTTEIPREKPLPKPKKETKWEAYAKLKGIQNKKKERMVWDETHQEYRPRWGYKRANDETKAWMIEVPENADPLEDQYEKRVMAKKERVAKNEFQRLRNLSKSDKTGKSQAANSLAPSAKPTKEQVNLALNVAKTSTASVGKFTKSLPKEHEVKKPKGKKRKFESNTGSLSNEKEKQLNLITNMANKQPRINTHIAVKQNRKEEQQQRMENNAKNPMSKSMARKQAAILSGKKGRTSKRKKGRK